MKEAFGVIIDFLGDVTIILLALVVLNLKHEVEELKLRDNKVDTLYIEVPLFQPPLFVFESPDKHLMDALEYYGVKHKDIVYAQAILETGYFKSEVYKRYKNLFGLYNSYKEDYYQFNHWTESIEAYLKYIQYRYKPPNDYYQFLDEIGYAEDTLYTSKLKKIVNRMKR